MTNFRYYICKFIIHFIIVPPVLILAALIWVVIGLFNIKKLGEVMVVTGDGLMKYEGCKKEDKGKP